MDRVLAKASRAPQVCWAAALLMAALAAGAARPSVAAETLVLSAEECGDITRHDPADAAYEPGVDARGRAVASADLDSNRMDLPEDLTIDLTALVFELLQREPPLGLGETKVALGKIVVNKSGLITYNDKPLGDTYQNAIAQACRERGFQ